MLQHRASRSSAGASAGPRGCSSSGTPPERPQGELADLGLYRLENRDWLPHVTVLRYRDRPRLSPELPELGSVVPSEAAAYLSRLHPSGAVYEVLESFPLKSLNSREVEG